MTVIITALFPSHVVQVSDRMLTWLQDDRRVKHQEDRWNKATVLRDRAAIAATGVARLRTRRTDQWIAETLQTANETVEAVELLRDEANRCLSLGEFRPPELAIVVAGWVEREGAFFPERRVITNSLDSTGKPVATRDSFDVWTAADGGRDVGVYFAGVPTNGPKFEANLQRLLTRMYKKNVSMRAIVKQMVKSGLDLKNRYVGQSFNAVILPRPVVGRETQPFVAAGPEGPDPEGPRAYFVAGRSAGPEYTIPNRTGSGIVVTDTTVYPGRVFTPEQVAERYRAGPPMPPWR